VQLGDLLDLAGSPGLVEERLQWAEEAQYGDQPLPGVIWIRLPSAAC
jgi:hypothetical protein